MAKNGEDQHQDPTTENTTGTGTENGTQGADGATEDQESITLTARELQAKLDREVTKAIQTRTANLTRELEATKEKLAEMERQKQDSGLDAAGKLESRERELKGMKDQVKQLTEVVKRYEQELSDMVQLELDSLSEEDREVAQQALPEDITPAAKLRILRALRNSGKLGGADAHVERPEGVGTKTAVGQGKSGKKGPDSEFVSALQQGRSLAEEAGATKPEGIQPEGW